MKNIILGLFSLIIVGIAVIILGFLWLQTELNKEGTFTKDTLFTIEKGSSVRHIAKNLQKQNLIGNDWLFLAGTKIMRVDKKLQSGEFLIPAKSSINQIIKIIITGKQYQYSITIPEGLNIYQIMEIINNDKNLTGKITIKPKEGYLFPETYYFSKGTTRNELIQRMQIKMQKILDREWNNKSKKTLIKNKEELLTLASIIEKETAIPSERRRVAGVFVNRLKRGMKLQTDPTVIYALTDGGKIDLNRKLYFKDLKIKHKFNTYYIVGLPPAPICSPSLASIKATLNPEKHDFLYFVADGSGGHKFAKSLKEHNNNVKNWRKINKSK